MIFTATVHNDSVDLPTGIHLPDGTLVRLEPLTSGYAGLWPEGYFDRTAGALRGEKLERPEQSAQELREDW